MLFRRQYRYQAFPRLLRYNPKAPILSTARRMISSVKAIAALLSMRNAQAKVVDDYPTASSHGRMKQ